MKPISEKNIKPLKKLKALKKQKEDAAQSVKPAIRIQELKNKLIILGHELFATKKINQSLYRKLQLITYSRTTEQKLKDSYKTLKDIDNNIKQSDASQDKQKGAPKPKKITVKAFTENKKIVDEDSSILYNIYLKYKVWYIIDRKSEKPNYKLFINNVGENIHTLWEIKQSTLQSYGRNNIIKEIKIFIEIALNNPYTYKIKVLDVHLPTETI